MKKTAAAKSKSPDGFVYFADSPFGPEHGQLDTYLSNPKSSKLRAESVKFPKENQVRLLCAALERMEFQKTQKQPNDALTELIKTVSGRKLPYREEDASWIVNCAANIARPADAENVQYEECNLPIPGVVPAILEYIEGASREKLLSKEIVERLTALQSAMKPMEFYGGFDKTIKRIEALLKQKPTDLPDETEPWASAISRDVAAMESSRRGKWMALLENRPKSTKAEPTAKWKKQAEELLTAVGHENFAKQLETWFGLVGTKAVVRIESQNENFLRALVWYASLLQGETICRALGNAAEGCLRKIGAGTLYASSISKACIRALEAMPGLEPIAQLGRLKYRVKSPWGQEEIQKAFLNAVHRSGLSPEEVEELTLPTFGLDASGKLRQQIGDFAVEVAVEGTRDVDVRWFDKKQAPLEKEPKGAPAPEVKAAKRLAGDIEKMLGAQRDRIERLLNTERVWPYPVWRQRYLEHPLVGGLSRALLWHFRQGKSSAAGIWHKGKLVQLDGSAIPWLSAQTEVRLWHPLGVKAEDVLAWRVRLEQHEVTQPFKQAHREIYLLTDAELKTRTYSNRFAAHILRQHQFKALCNHRGWKYEFIGSWDSGDNGPGATLDLPQWKLQAQFWIDGAGDAFADSGVALNVATDQVRFCAEGGEPVRLTDVPALAFTEVMRDVDLFVGVCSIASDPTWADQGADGERNYWREWSFGDLSTTAEIRRDVLARLLPKLKIADQSSLDGKFLVVRGNLGSYKIHLGSANVLMAPNDKYLCIVPDRNSRGSGDLKVWLPFEGDNTLAIILSKAFLLADDSKIKDQSILRQIEGK